MNRHIKHQLIEKNGKPEYAVISYSDFVALTGGEEPTIPHEVVGLTIKKGYSLIRAWRDHLGLTQKEVAKKLGISQPALMQMEKPNAKPRKATLEKLAKALGVNILQLRL